MRRLTDYLCALADLYGSENKVHFDSVKPGCVQLVTRIEADAFEGVLHQVREVAGNLASAKAQRGYLKLSELMTEDRVNGSLIAGGAKIIQFPRVKNTEKPLRVIKSSSVQGRLYSIGGKDSTVPVRLEGPGGESLLCEADTALAKSLAPLLFKTVRLAGNGEWERKPNGDWRLIKLKVTSFSGLEETSFKDAVRKMKDVGGINWGGQSDAYMEILGARG